jgi:hypothetical protein
MTHFVPFIEFIISVVISFVLSLSFVTNSWTAAAAAISNTLENPTIIGKQTLNVDKRRS